jgi:asparagine synthase (glutamine-hydrolysing)
MLFASRDLLTGEGSDEVFAGYPFFRRDLLLHAAQSASPEERQRPLAELEATNQVSSGNLMPQGSTALDAVERVLGYVPSNLQAWAQIGLGLIGVASEEFLAAFAGRDTFRVMLGCLDVGRQLTGRHPLNQSLYIWSKTMLPNYILSNLGDRMEMAHSVEGRLPFLDHHLVEEAAKMPVTLKVNGMTEKYALR